MENEAPNALAERIGEVIEEFSECNETDAIQVLEALEWVYACVERYNDATPAFKMH